MLMSVVILVVAGEVLINNKWRYWMMKGHQSNYEHSSCDS